MTPTPTTVVLTGIGLDGGPDIIRALRADRDLGARIVGVDADPRRATAHICDAFELVPDRDAEGYVEAVAAIAEAEGARVIYPLPTGDQEPFAKAREGLASRGIAVTASPPASVRICNDKWQLYERLRARRPELVPWTERVHDARQLQRAVTALGYPQSRACIRRPTSRGAIGFRVLDAGSERLQALLHRNPESRLVSLAEVLDTLSVAGEFPEYLVQEYLPGEEWDADVLCRAGEPIVVVTRRTLAMVGGAATDAVLEPAAEVDAVARELVAELELDAVVNLAFRADAEGILKLLEINPRVPMSVLAGLAGGVNLVALAVRQALGERIEPREPEWGGRFLLHYQSMVIDPRGRPVISP